MERKVIASIGTIDPRNVGGVGRDLTIIAQHHMRGVCAIAGVSAQDEGGVRALHAVPRILFEQELSVLPDASAYRVGALAGAENVSSAATFLQNRRGWIVIDPVMRATRGGSLYADEAAALHALREQLCVLPAILTPNLDEAAALSGIAVSDVHSMERAGLVLCKRGARAVIVKGGHLDAHPVDVLCTAQSCVRFQRERIDASCGGKGCAFAATLACALASGAPLNEAVACAGDFVRGMLREAQGQPPAEVQSAPFA